MKPCSSLATTSPIQSVHGSAPRKQKNEKEEPRAVAQRHRLQLAARAVKLNDLAAVAHGDAVAVELGQQVVGHRLAQVGAPVKKGDQGAAPGKPHRRLSGGVATADDATRVRRSAGLGRAGGVEDAHALVVLEVADRQAPVVGAGGDHDGARDDLVPFLEVARVESVARLERQRRGTASPSGRRTCAPA